MTSPDRQNGLNFSLKNVYSRNFLDKLKIKNIERSKSHINIPRSEIKNRLSSGMKISEMNMQDVTHIPTDQFKQHIQKMNIKEASKINLKIQR